jgi:hypothetical protein
MKRYSVAMLIVALLLAVGSALFDTIQVGNAALDLGSLLLNISAGLFALVLIAIIYHIFGDEEVVELMKELLLLQRTSRKMRELGVERVEAARSEIAHKDIHKALHGSVQIFIAAQHFSAVKYSSVRHLFEATLTNPQAQVQIVICTASPARSDLLAFRDQLSDDFKKRFLVRHALYVRTGLYGSEKGLYATIYISDRTGDECPTIFCLPSTKNDNGLFALFRSEFESTWRQAEVL